MTGNAGFYNGMERDLANHNQGLEQSVLEVQVLRLIPNLQLTSAGRTGTAKGPQIALGPHFAQVCSNWCSCAG